MERQQNSSTTQNLNTEHQSSSQIVYQLPPQLTPSQTQQQANQKQHHQIQLTQKRQSSTNSSNSNTKGSSPNIHSKKNYINQGNHLGPNSQIQKTYPQQNDRKNGASNSQSRNQQRGMIRDPRPEKVIALDKYQIQQVICGSDQTFCITTQPESHVYSWGSNQNAKLGHSYYKPSPNNTSSSSIQIVKQPTIVKGLENQKIDGLSCGTSHSFAWSSETGIVYGWGLGLNGRLGNENEGLVLEPKVLECLKQAMEIGMKVLQISCGENHTLALIQMPPSNEGDLAQNKLFVWGNNDKMQLGMDNQIDSNNDESQTAKEIGVPHQLDPDPFQSQNTNKTYANHLIGVYASYYYSAALTSNGNVFTWGSGEFGRLGYMDIKKQPQPKILKELTGSQVTRISLGYYHGAAVTEKGVVFTWGRGINGQLGHGSVLNEDQVRPVSALQNIHIVDISCGESHTLALTNKGEVYSWGGGQLGQLGHGDFLRQSLPIKVANLEDNIIQISAGKRHSAALNEEGKLFTWGSNEYGQLGRQANVTVGLYLKGSGSGNGSYNNSAKTSPSMNLIQGHPIYNKIPNSTDNQMIHKFEFPTSKGNSDGDLDSNNIFLNKIAIDSVNLSWSQSPHQIFAPSNRLHEISPYNQKGVINSSHNLHDETAYTGLVNHQSKLTQLEINSICSDNSNSQQQQYPAQYYQGGLLTSSSQQQQQHYQQLHQAPYFNHQYGGGSIFSSGLNSVVHQDETPKYIKNLRGELNVALKKNMELRLRLEQMEEEQEIGIQNNVIEIGEVFSQKIKESMTTQQIEQVQNRANEALDQYKGQQNLKRFVKNNLDALASLRKEVLLQNIVINQFQQQKQMAGNQNV